jgi:hypothetical protein
MGRITFLSEDGRNGTCPINNGEYSVAAPVGMSQIEITGGSPDPHPAKRRMPPGQMKLAQESGAVFTEPPASDYKGKTFKIPGKYGHSKTSGLTFEVQKGEQTKNFDLTH